MITLDAIQGTELWLSIRAKHFTASEAPAMMGSSKYATRSDLLKQKATGITSDVDSSKQRLFDWGHAAEEAARPLVETLIGESLYPITGSLEVDGLQLLASFDGLTAMDDIVWETKLWNASLANAVRAGQLDPHYYWQLEQQLLVSGAEHAYFTTTDGTPENTVGMWYTSSPARRAALISGWKQFAIDLENYQHIEKPVAPIAAPIEALPALAVTVSGSISLTHNLERFGQRLSAFVGGLNNKPETDQDFADLDAAVKVLKEAEAALDSAEKNALAQTTTIADMCSLVEMYRKVARDNRLMFEKIVRQEKINRKAAIMNQAGISLVEHVGKLNTRIGGNWMPVVDNSIFAAAVTGLKSLDSMRDKVATALANAKIEANEIADRIEANRKVMEQLCDPILFPDFAQVCTKQSDDFSALVAMRVSQDEARKEAERLAAEAKTASAVAAAIEAERMAEANRIADAAQQETANLTANNQTKFIAPEAKRAAVVEAQDDIAAFMNSRDFGKEPSKIRAILVEFVKFQAERGLKVEA